MADEDLISLPWLLDVADEVWKDECESGGDAEAATNLLIDYVAENLCSYIPIQYRRSDDWAKPYELLAKQIVEEHVKNFEEYEEQSHKETALQEAERDIRNETMRNL